MDFSTFWSIDIVGYVQIAFWLVVGGLSILTYVQAKKSFFQPLRTEVFKLQLALLTRVSDLFVSKSETDLREFFGFHEALQINAQLMREEYAREVGGEVPEGEGILERARDVLGGAQVSMESRAAIRLVSAPSEHNVDDAEGQPEQTWDDYEHDFVHITKEFGSALSEIEALSREPLLPSDLRVLLESLVTAAHANLHAIRATMKEAAAKMPASYPTLDSLKGAELHWVENIWIRKSTPLTPIAHEIVAFTRTYFAPEMIGYSGASGPARKAVKKKAREASPLLESAT